MSEESKIRLKPVVYTTSKFNSGAPEKTKQLFLLKALQVTQDPNKLRQLLGVRTVAEVYRTLDKLAIRKEYHEALARSGITLDFIVDGIKNIASSGRRDGDKLKAFETLLKSVGLDKYENDAVASGGTWEEALLKAGETNEKNKQLNAPDKLPEYEVVIPEVPESVKKMQEQEEELLKSVYDSVKK